MSFNALLLAGAFQTLKFKTSFDKATIESQVRFSNAKGGAVLVVGDDNGCIHEVTLGKESLSEWLGQIKSATSTAIEIEVVNGKIVVLIWMSEFPVKPFNTCGQYFNRVASSNHQLKVT